jgi:Lamin Tail Domain/Secretion system C-terminal sorting domain
MKTSSYFLFFVLMFLITTESYCQLSINDLNTNYTIDFDNTVTGVNNGAYQGTGFSSSPSSGQLNSNAWAATGMSDGNSNFGDENISGDFAKGSSSGGVGTGGFYSFKVSNNNYAFGIQSGTSDWTPGTVTLRIKNNSGYTLHKIEVSYKIYVYNDQDRASSFNFSYSSDDNNFTSVGALDFTSAETADATPSWSLTNKSTTLSGLSIANGAYLYLSWSGDDVSGSGSRDEFALDDITINAVEGSASSTTVSFITSDAEVNEGDGTYNLNVQILNPSSGNSTTADVVLTKGDNADIDNYSTQTVTFPAGSNADQTVTITITDDNIREGDDTLTFELQNISGGNSAAAGLYSTFNLIIHDNDIPEVVINEILADPPDGDAGDANGDGVRDGHDDEFVEIINASGSGIDISGWKLYEGTTLRHIFPDNTIVANNKSIVVFGGGTPQGIPGIVQVASEGHLDLTNSGDVVTLKDNNDITIDSYSYGNEGNDNQSLARNPDVTGDFVKHNNISTNPVNFSPGRSNSNNAALPVQLESFSAERSGKKVILNWQTETEVDNYGFNIERLITKNSKLSSVNSHWVKIGFVKGAGTSNSPHYYSFKDTKLSTSGNYFYRLKQINADGSYKYSDQVRVKFNFTGQYHLSDNYPNPFNPVTIIKYSLAEKSFVSLKVYDILGRKVRTLEKSELNPGNYSVNFNSEGLASGLYIYRLYAKPTNGGKTFTSAKEMVLMK